MTPAQLLTHFERISEAPDAISRLRGFILNLAVRGKLIQQDSDSESECTPKLSLDVYKPSRKSCNSKDSGAWPYSAPKTWHWSRLADICSQITDGEHATPPRILEHEVPLTTAKNVRDGFMDYNDTDWVSVETADKAWARCRPAVGDILLVCVGATTGRLCVLRESRDMVLVRSVALVRPIEEVTADYLALALRSPVCQSEIWSKVKATAQPCLYLNRISSLPIPLPPLEKQHRIVAKVDELMALCDRLEAAQTEREQRRDRLAAASLQRLNQPDAEPSVFREHIRFHLRHLSRLTTRPEQITQLRQTLLSLAVRGRIVSQEPSDEPSAELLKRIHAWQISALAERRIRLPRKPLLGIGKEEVPYGLPKRWVWARLGELIYIRSGDGLTLEQMIPGHVPVYGGNGVAGFHNVANIQSPTLVIGRVGYYCGSIHVTPPEAWVTDNAFITEFCSDAISQKFLVLLLKATNLKEKKNATAQPVISGTKIYPIVVGLPPLAEQYRIVAKVDELMAVCDQLETQLTTTQTESQRFLEAVLHQALEYAHKSSQ